MKSARPSQKPRSQPRTLYLVRHAMTAHGGRMDVSSTPGKGSTFTLVLPGASPGSKEITA